MDRRRTWAGNLIAALSAFFLTCGVALLYRIRYGGSTMFTNSVAATVLFAAALYLGYRFFKGKVTGRLIVSGLIGGLIFASCTAFGYSLHYTDTIWNNLTFGALVCFVPFFSECTAFGFEILGGVRGNEAEYAAQDDVTSHAEADEGADAKADRQAGGKSRRRYLITFAVLFVCWIPTLLASWPGIFSYDCGTQLSQWVDGAVTAHHPVLHTALLGVTRMIGQAVNGSNQTGALIYSIVQMLIMSALYAYVLLFLYKKNTPKWLQIGAFIFLAFHPANSLMALSATKDSIFGALFSVFIVQLIEIADDREAFFKGENKEDNEETQPDGTSCSRRADKYGHLKKQAAFIVTVFFLFAFRNNAFHAFLICIPFLLIAFRKYWKKMLGIIVVCLALYFVYTGPVYTVLGIEDGDVREMLSVPMQQLARVYNLDYLGLTDEQRGEIELYIDEEGLSSYLSYFADPVKAYFDSDEFAEDRGGFFKIWFSVGMTHKRIYVDSFLANTYGYWYPGNSAVETDSGKEWLEYGCSEYRDDVDVCFESKWPALSDFYDSIASHSSFENIPVVSALFSPGTYTWLLIFACLLILYTKKYGDIIVMVPFAAYFFTNLLGPIVKLRYHYPIIACAPLILYLIWKVWKGAHSPLTESGGAL